MTTAHDTPHHDPGETTTEVGRRFGPLPGLSGQAFGKPVCRLGLASRGQSAISPDDVLHALERGVNFLNWPGVADTPGGADAFSDAIAALGRGASRSSSASSSVPGRPPTPPESSARSWPPFAPTTSTC